MQMSNKHIKMCLYHEVLDEYKPKAQGDDTTDTTK